MTEVTKEYVDEQCMIGSTNAAWVPCVLDGGLPNNVFNVAEGVKNTGGTDYYLQFTLPLPTKLKNKKLHVDNVKVPVVAADGNDYLNMIKVVRMDYHLVTAIHTDNGDWKGPGDATSGFDAADCSGDDIVGVILHIVASNSNQIHLRGALLHCYYDD